MRCLLWRRRGGGGGRERGGREGEDVRVGVDIHTH